MSDQHDDEKITANFDQTNGLADGLQGDSDGTAVGEDHSAAERDEDDGTGVGIPPVSDDTDTDNR